MAKYHTKGGFYHGIQTFWNTIYLRLDPKEEILEEIGKVAKREYPPCTGHRPWRHQ